MQIGGLQELTLIDYPGKLAATVFLCGCNFRCPFCYSSEIVMPEKIKVQPEFSEKEVFNFLKSRKNLIEGVVICGGEPTMSKDLISFAEKLKKEGFFVKLDTNGSNSKILGNLIGKKLVDYVAMDIKAPFAAKIQNSNFKFQNYENATGVKINLAEIRKSVDIIKNSGIDYEFRTTVVPGIHTKEDILQMAKEISPAKKYFLQNFLAQKTLNKNFESVKPYPAEFLLDIQKKISPFFEVCQVR
jgi:pyruvate formate lyase activating enzyme